MEFFPDGVKPDMRPDVFYTVSAFALPLDFVGVTASSNAVFVASLSAADAGLFLCVDPGAAAEVEAGLVAGKLTP